MGRIQKSEVDKAIHSTKDTPEDKDHKITSFNREKLDPNITMFTFLGDHDYLEGNRYPAALKESSKVLAKQTRTKRGYTYEVKFDHNNQMFNPVGLYTNKSDEIFLRKRDIEKQKFVKVEKEVFDNYVQFLTTKNALWLTRANRLL